MFNQQENIASVTLQNHDLVSTTNYINPTSISDYETNKTNKRRNKQASKQANKQTNKKKKTTKINT